MPLVNRTRLSDANRLRFGDVFTENGRVYKVVKQYALSDGSVMIHDDAGNSRHTFGDHLYTLLA